MNEPQKELRNETLPADAQPQTETVAVEVPVLGEKDKQPSPEEIYNAFSAQVEARWNSVATSMRSKTAFKRGLIKGDGVPTEAGLKLLGYGLPEGDKTPKVLYEDKEIDPKMPLPMPLLRILVPLEGDTMRYVTYPKGHKLEGQARMAVDKYGFPSAGRVRGRRKPHASRTDLSVKALARAIFRTLFEAKAERLQAVCKEEKIEYQGVPESAIPEIGAQALKQASAIFARREKRARKVARRHQKFSRRVNAGLMPGNSNRKKFAHKGGN